MEWTDDVLMMLRALLAAFLGALIGLERERDGHEAGVRTHAIVALGACLFSQLGGDDRIAAQVITGIGFLGAGIIMRGGHHEHRVKGLTTAATLWATAAIGMTVAYHRMVLAILCTMVTIGVLLLRHIPGWMTLTRGRKETPLQGRGPSPGPPAVEPAKENDKP